MGIVHRLVVSSITSATVCAGMPAHAKARQTDFNGDGVADLACSAPSEAVSGHDDAGAVHVFYGMRGTGPTTSGDQFFTQDTSGIVGIAGPFEYFGEALAVGDFNGDGFSDLAIGVESDTIDGVNSAGSVNVLYGSHSGLKTSGDELWHRDVDGVVGDLQTYAFFGSALASGDFDGDGYDDLAIGIYGQVVNAYANAGEVHILYGSHGGLTASGDQASNQDTTGLADDAEAIDLFGRTLASGDFDGDGRDDLAIGVPYENVGAVVDAGAVYVLYGQSGGLSVDDNQFFTQDSDDVADDAEAEDAFGNELCAGDFDHNGKDDLVIGVYGETVGGYDFAGAVHVFYGRSFGLDAVNSDFWHQDVDGITDEAEAGGELFGYAFAAGDFNDDGRDDLAIGVPNEIVGAVENAGAVHLLRGTSNGLTASHDQFWHQNKGGTRDESQYNDFFGGALAAGDYDDDGHDDLAIGVVEESLSGQTSAGALAVLFGASGGLTSTGNLFWHQDTSGIPDRAAESEYFGEMLR